MQYLIFIYAFGAIVSLYCSLSAMRTPYATIMEVNSMAYGKSTALGNFLGNLFALITLTTFWPVVLVVYLFKGLRSGK